MDYTKSTNFAAKDALASGNAAKVVKGTEIDTEFNNIATAIATKTDDSSAAITGGTIDGTAIGGTTPAAGTFTTLTSTGNTVLGDASTDTLNVGNGGLIKDASGNVGIGVTPSGNYTLQAGSAYSTFKGASLGGFTFGASGSGYPLAGYNVRFTSTGDSYLYATSDFANGIVYKNGQFQFLTAASGTAGNAITFTQAMTLDASGNLGVGTTSPLSRLDLSTGTGQKLLTYSNSLVRYGLGVESNEWRAFATTGAVLTFGQMSNSDGTTFTERARIDSSGNFGIAQTDPTGNGVSGYNNLVIGNSSSSTCGITLRTTNSGTPLPGIVFARSTGGANGKVYYDQSTDRLYCQAGGSGGVYLASGGTSWTSASDERVKDVIEPIENAVQKLSNWRTVIGKYKTDDEGKRRTFLFAQDVLETLPEAVDTVNPEEYGLNYQDTIPVLVKAIQEQQAIIEQLTNRITALEAK